MRKILSVILVVVMLAALVTVFPASAAAKAPELVITEICVDTAGIHGKDITTATQTGDFKNNAYFGGDVWSINSADIFEFVELYNASDKAISLYDYVITLNSSLSVGTAPDGESFTDFTPICSPAMMKEAGNVLGTISTTSAPLTGTVTGTNTTLSSETSIWPFYPTNPDKAVIQPGETAVVWLFTFDAFSHNVALSTSSASGSIGAIDRAIDFEEFREFWGLDAGTVVVAVDANGSTSTGSTYSFNGAALKNKKGNNVISKLGDAWSSDNIRYRGCNGAAVDLMTNLFPSSDGRYNGANSGSRYYGLAKNELFKAADARTTVKHSEITSYAYVNYDAKDATTNLAYKCSAGATSGSHPDSSYNFTYTEAASEYKIGKVAGKVEFADWLTCQYATPGKLLPEQAADLTVLGSSPKASARRQSREASIFTFDTTNPAFVTNGVNNDKKGIIYYEDFQKYAAGTVKMTNLFTTVNGTDVKWRQTNWLDGASIDSGAIMTIEADASGNQRLAVYNNTNKDKFVTILTTADMLKACADLNPDPATNNYMCGNLLYEYDIEYLNAYAGDRYASLIFNYDDYCTYDVFILRVCGRGNSQRRISGQYVTWDIAGEFSAANDDKTAGNTSIVNKLTNGRIFCANGDVDAGTSYRLVNLEDRKLHVSIVYDQTQGAFIYVNNILVSKPANTIMLGAARNRQDFGIGLQISQYVDVAFDNIKVTALPTDDDFSQAYLFPTYFADWTNIAYIMDGNDAYNTFDRIYANSDSQEPATGDATIYVVIAMAVSFISLAALVVVKRRKER